MSSNSAPAYKKLPATAVFCCLQQSSFAPYHSGMNRIAPSEDDTLYWEDFPAGNVRDCGSTTVSREAILDFARQFDPQPFHVDEQAAKNSLFGGLAASGWHTCGIAMRLMCDAYLLRTTSQGSPGIDELRWLKPVRPGDTLRLRMTVLDARPMRSKPHLGLVQSHWELFNQHDDCVLSMKGWGIFIRQQQDEAEQAGD